MSRLFLRAGRRREDKQIVGNTIDLRPGKGRARSRKRFRAAGLIVSQDQEPALIDPPGGDRAWNPGGLELNHITICFCIRDLDRLFPQEPCIALAGGSHLIRQNGRLVVEHGFGWLGSLSFPGVLIALRPVKPDVLAVRDNKKSSGLLVPNLHPPLGGALSRSPQGVSDPATSLNSARDRRFEIPLCQRGVGVRDLLQYLSHAGRRLGKNGH